MNEQYSIIGPIKTNVKVGQNWKTTELNAQSGVTLNSNGSSIHIVSQYGQAALTMATPDDIKHWLEKKLIKKS